MTIARFEDAGAVPAATDTPLSGLIGWLTTTDHKRIGLAYLATAFAFFLVGGAMAALMRAELASPGLQLVNADQYNQLFTIHGTVMMFLFAVPMASGFANYLIPLQIGAPDMAFPRVNALSYWLFLGGGLVVLSGFVTSEGAASFGWTAYVPLSDNTYTPGAGGDLWITGLALTGIATTLTSVNVLATVIGLRAPGMSMFRLPLFTWNMVAVSFMVLLAFPVITGALMMLLADRSLEAHFFTAEAGGDPILYQHLFWFFGHPEVYIVALPFFGVISEIIPVFSRQPLFGYKAVVVATVLIAAYSLSVWAHHMFTTGAIVDNFFSGTTLLIAVPTGIKIFSWVFTMWGGRVRFPTPMLHAIGFLVVFLIGGLTGPMLAVRAFDSHVHDTYFVVAHMHYVLLGTSVFAMFGALYFWWPKFFGHRLREGLGHVQFWLLFVGFNLTFFPQHILGLRGMPRRYADYPEGLGYDWLNLVSSLSVILLAVSVLVFLANVWVSARRSEPAGDDPWEANTLEWATSSPPPPHNFTSLPRIRSERPVFDERQRQRQEGEQDGGRE